MPTESSESPLNEVRDAFRPLKTPDKAVFVIEAALATVGDALRDAATQVGETLESFDVEDFCGAQRAREQQADSPETDSQES